MSLVFNMVGGGSGGGGGPSASDAILTVTVPTGSTVTAVKGGVTLTPTMWVQAADATLDCALFVITPAQFDSVNPWTVTATLDANRATADVTIDSNKQYDVAISYIVPPEYQAVEYLEIGSTRGPWLHTDHIITVDDEYETCAQYTAAPDNDTWIAGAFQNNYNYHLVGGYYNSRLQITIGATSGSISFDTSKHIYSATRTAMLIDSVQVGTPNWNNNPALELIIFGRSTNSSYGTALTKNVRLYYVKIWTSGELVKHFVPCYRKSDNVAGMWERVGEQFYMNSGSGSFIVGPDL